MVRTRRTINKAEYCTKREINDALPYSILLVRIVKWISQCIALENMKTSLHSTKSELALLIF